MLNRDARFRQPVAGALAAVEQETCGERGNSSETFPTQAQRSNRLVLEHRVAADPDAPPDLLFDLFEQVRTAAGSTIGQY
jgi:hypothetical protein